MTLAYDYTGSYLQVIIRHLQNLPDHGDGDDDDDAPCIAKWTFSISMVFPWDTDGSQVYTSESQL